MNTIETTPPLRLIRFPEVQRRCSLCRTTIYDRILSGDFPAPRKLGRMSVWVEAEIDQWIQSIAETSQGVKS